MATWHAAWGNGECNSLFKDWDEHCDWTVTRLVDDVITKMDLGVGRLIKYTPIDLSLAYTSRHGYEPMYHEYTPLLPPGA